MVWTAAISSSGNEILVTRSSGGIDYRSDSYPLAHLRCRKWVEKTSNYLSLILLDLNETVITITDDPASESIGNTLLGTALPLVAYNSFTALVAAGGSTSASEAAVVATATNTAEANTLQTEANVTLGSILSELTNTKTFGDLVVQDSNKTYFIRKEVYDQTTELTTVQFYNFNNTIGTPVGAVLPAKLTGSGDSIVENKYYANLSGVGFSVGDSLCNLILIDGETRAITVLGWLNITTGLLLSTPPPPASLKGYEDKIEEILTNLLAIESANNTSLVELGDNADVSVPADNLDPATLKGLIRRSNNLIEAASSVAAIGSESDSSIASTPISPGNLKSIERGLWQSLINILGDPTELTIPGSVNEESTLKGLSRLSIVLIQSLLTTITNRSQFTRITNGSADLSIKSGVPITTDNAAVVALSPNSAPLQMLPATDISATGTISITGGVAGQLVLASRGVANFQIAGVWTAVLQVQISADGSTWSNLTGNYAVYDLRNKVFLPSGNITSSGVYQVNVSGLKAVRLICVALASGTANITAHASSVSSLVVIEGTVAEDIAAVKTANGVDVTGVTQLLGGSGIRGWLSGIFSRISLGGQPLNNSISTAIPRKLLIPGITTGSTAAVINMLDATFTGGATDVRDYNSGALIVPAAPLGGTWRISAGFNSSALADDTYLLSGVFVPAMRIYPLNLQGVNFIRVSCINANAANVQLVLSQAPYVAQGLENKAIPDAVSATIAASSATTLAGGLLNAASYQVEVVVTAFATTSVILDVQESNDGVAWNTIYRFQPILAVGTYRSGYIPQTGAMVRYVESIVGGAITITRSITRIPSLLAPNIAINTKQLGGWNITDIPFGGRCRTIIANNLSNTPLYVQIHNIATLFAASVPLAGKVFPLPANGSVFLGTGDLGEQGSRWGDNQRVVLSLTPTIYTQIPAALLIASPNQLVSLHLETN